MKCCHGATSRAPCAYLSVRAYERDLKRKLTRLPKAAITASRRSAAQKDVATSLESYNREQQRRRLYSGMRFFDAHGVQQRMVQSVSQFYDDVWNWGNLELLQDLAAPHVQYRDPNCYQESFDGIKRVTAVVADFRKMYPTIAFQTGPVLADPHTRTAMVHWSATGAHLGTRMGRPATGRQSSISGMAMFSFAEDVSIEIIVTYRQPLDGEKAAFITETEWDDSP